MRTSRSPSVNLHPKSSCDYLELFVYTTYNFALLFLLCSFMRPCAMIHAIISQNDSVQILSFQKGSCVTNVQVKDENVFLQTPRFSCVLVWLVLQFAEMCMGWRLVWLVRFFACQVGGQICPCSAISCLNHVRRLISDILTRWCTIYDLW